MSFMSNLKKRLEKNPMPLITGILAAVVLLSGVFYTLIALNDIKKPESYASEVADEEPQETGSSETEETPASETPEETSESNTETTTESQTETTTEEETESEKEPRAVTEIHTLGTEDLDRIRQTYSSNLNGFGTGIQNVEVDESNRPVMANNLVSRFENRNADVTAYCAGPRTAKAALTFQNGMETGYTEQVLDILKANDIKATFYITHAYAAQNSAIVKRMIAEGHEVGSHSYTSPEGGIAALPLEDQMADAINLQNYVDRAFGYNMQKYNFNDGVWTEQAVMLMSEMGYEVCFCSCNYSDYDPELEFDREEVLGGLERSLHNGCVYCFHTTNKITADILQELIDFIKEQGFTIVQLN